MITPSNVKTPIEVMTKVKFLQSDSESFLNISKIHFSLTVFGEWFMKCQCVPVKKIYQKCSCGNSHKIYFLGKNPKSGNAFRFDWTGHHKQIQFQIIIKIFTFSDKAVYNLLLK